MPRTTSGGQGAPTWQTFLMPCQSGASDGRTSAHEELVVIDLVTAVVPNLPPDRIRTLPFGTGVTLLRSAPPIITDLTAWPTRPDADTLKRDRRELEQLLQVGPAAQDE